MSDRYRIYARIVDRLRARRSAPGWKADQDREDLAMLEDLYGLLAPEEQTRVNAEGWKSWPDLYDERMDNRLVERSELKVDGDASARLAA